MHRVFSRYRSAIALSAGLFAATSAHASGFRIPETSVTGLGTSNAVVANQKELGALPYNPAVMSFHDGTNVAAGLIAIDPSTSVTNATGSHDSNPDTPFYVPDAYIMGHINPALTWGVGINAPFGLETKWDSSAFPVFGQTAAQVAATVPPPAGLIAAAQIAGSSPTYSKIEMANINPNVAYKIGDNLSIAAGVDYYYVNDVNLNTTGADIHGDGSDFGYNLAALFTTGPWSVGASYRSAVAVKIDGSVDTALGSNSASTSLDFPSILQIGVRHQTTDKLALEFDIDRTGWSTFDRIVITQSNGQTIVSTNNWKDVNAYRLGATYDVSSATQLRFGYTYDKTPQSEDNFSARVPDANRNLFSVGVAQKLNGWTVEGGYMYVKVKDRTITGSPYNPAVNPDPNGTTAYGGTYKTSIHLLGIGVSTKF